MLKDKCILIILIVFFGLMCSLLGMQINQQNNLNLQDGYYFEEGFSLKIPETWEENTSLGALTFMNVSEENEEIPEFKSYIFLINEKLSGRSSYQYFDYLKTKVENLSTEFEILDERDEGKNHIIILKTKNNDIDYVIAMGLVEGLSDNYWVVSLNTLASRWENLEPIFYETLNSFRLR